MADKLFEKADKLLEKTVEFEATRYKSLPRLLKVCFIVLATSGVLFAILWVFGFTFRGSAVLPFTYYYFLMAAYLPGAFLIMPARRKEKRVPWYDLVAAALAFLIPFYFCTEAWPIAHVGWIPPTWSQLVLALILCILVVEAGRRMAGSVYVAVCIFFGLYPVFAGYMPGMLFGVSSPFDRTIALHVFSGEGLLGVPCKVIGDILIGFLLFAAVLIASGAGNFFIDLALSLCGRFRGGPAKVSVVSSALFGTISGSAVSNVVADGPITIPTMIRVGYPPYYAAAIEAVTSTGGILMPPVMGTVAFVMAAFLGIEYREVCIAAAIPAILYYFALLMQIDAYAAKVGLVGLPREELPSLRKTLKMGWPFLAVLLFLMWGLLYMQWEMYTPFYASLLMFLLSFRRRETAMTPRKIINTLATAGQLITQTIAVVLPISFIIAGLTVTGTSTSFTSGIVDLGGGNVLLILFLGAVACFILGMAGMMVSAYIFLGVTLAPAAIQAGHLNTIAVHLFILYYTMISCITPPVAVAAFVAAAIAGSDPMKTGLQAMRLGIVVYFIPFFFVYNPALILQGPILQTLVFFILALIGIMLIAAGMEGYLWKIGRIALWSRVLLFIAGLLTYFPEIYTTIVGLVLALFVVASTMKTRKRAAATRI